MKNRLALLPHSLSRIVCLSFFILCLLPCSGADYAQLTNLPTLYVETLNGRSITSRTT